MKFGKHLIKQQLPEWASHYMNYKALKKRIKTAETATDAAEVALAKKEFFAHLDRELDKVNTFYVGKEADLRSRVQFLLEKKGIAFSGNPRHNAESLQTFFEAFSYFEHELIKLQNFVEMNATGFRKILKKFDRRAKATTKEIYLTSHVDVQPCFNRDILAELADVASVNLSEINHYIRDATEEKLLFEKFMHNADFLEADLLKAVTVDDTTAVSEIASKLRALDVSNTSDWLNRALRRACLAGRTSAAEHLLSLGANPSLINEISGRSCLHEAARNGHIGIVKLLVATNKIDVNITDIQGRRALHFAVMGNFIEVVQFLISQHAIINGMDQDASSPLVCAIINRYEECARILIEHSPASEVLVDAIGRSHLALACQSGNPAIVQMLIERGGNIADVNTEGLTLLHISCSGGHTDCVKILTARGADIHAVEKDSQWTPLFFCASEGHSDCVRVLLDAGANVAAQDESGWTAWQYAIYAGHMETAALLKAAASDAIETTTVSSASSAAAPPAAAAAASATTAATTVPATAVDDDDMPPLDLDGIPSLSLPPPIIPVKIYGHSFLENKVQVQLKLGNPSASSGHVVPLSLTGAHHSSSIKINISAKPDLGIPHTVTLPLEDDQETFSFVANSLESITLQFDIMPMFGSKVIGRAIALPSAFKSSVSKGTVRLPVLDNYLDLIGELAFEYIVIKPLEQATLSAVGGKVKTYWKTTTVLSPKPPTQLPLKRDLSAVPSMVTGSSLVNDYILLNVVTTRDNVPVILPSWTLENSPFDLAVNDLTLAQLQGILSRDNKRKAPPESEEAAAEAAKSSSLVTLEQALTTIDPNVGICLELTYPSDAEIFQMRTGSLPDPNLLVDTILMTIFATTGTLESRSLMFCSANPQLCLITNLKQPNFPVMFRTFAGLHKHPTDARCNSIQQAVRFSKAANLLGIVCEATSLIDVPALITTMKEEGLIVASFGDLNLDQANVKLQESAGVDAVAVGNKIQVVRASQQWF